MEHRGNTVGFVGCNNIFEYTCNKSGKFITLCKLQFICTNVCRWGKEKELIEGIDEISKVLHMAETADMALIGIGSMQKDSSIIKAGIRTEEEYKELMQKGAVGEIVGRIYDKNGQTVDEDLQRKMIGISLDKIAKIPVRVGISYGKDKIEAIKGAIAGGLVNVLVTDVPTAELLLK